MVVHKASCHCKQVQIEINAPEELELIECNCSICSIKGIIHLIVSKDNFKLKSGAEEGAQTTYTFGTGMAKHKFCSKCGICVYYIPRSNPDGFDVNFRCIDKSTVKSYSVKPFDGKDSYDKLVGELHHLSK